MQALEELRLIRETMERAGAFRAVPGMGAVLMGLVAVFADALATRQADREGWTLVWLCGALVAMTIGGWALRAKASSAEASLLSAPGRRFLACLGAPLVAGAVLTAALWQRELLELLPGLWLMLYGAGVFAAGILSLGLFAAMGACFMLLGALALLVVPSQADALMSVGFGAGHLFFGLLIATRHHGKIRQQAFPG